MKKVKDGVVRNETSVPFVYLCITPFILSLLAAIFYKSSLNYAFQFDDLANITKLYSIRNSTFSQLFFQSSRWISYWLNTIHYKIGKFNPEKVRFPMGEMGWVGLPRSGRTTQSPTTNADALSTMPLPKI